MEGLNAEPVRTCNRRTYVLWGHIGPCRMSSGRAFYCWRTTVVRLGLIASLLALCVACAGAQEADSTAAESPEASVKGSTAPAKPQGGWSQEGPDIVCRAPDGKMRLRFPLHKNRCSKEPCDGKPRLESIRSAVMDAGGAAAKLRFLVEGDPFAAIDAYARCADQEDRWPAACYRQYWPAKPKKGTTISFYDRGCNEIAVRYHADLETSRCATPDNHRRLVVTLIRPWSGEYDLEGFANDEYYTPPYTGSMVIFTGAGRPLMELKDIVFNGVGLNYFAWVGDPPRYGYINLDRIPGPKPNRDRANLFFDARTGAYEIVSYKQAYGELRRTPDGVVQILSVEYFRKSDGTPVDMRGPHQERWSTVQRKETVLYEHRFK